MKRDHDTYRPQVAAQPDKHLIIVVARNPQNEITTSVRFNRKYARQLALDILDMEEHA